jgi:hypothetical protein
MKRILLESEDFEKLTSGEIIKKDNVEIYLTDIGWYKMMAIIRNNMIEKL